MKCLKLPVQPTCVQRLIVDLLAHAEDDVVGFVGQEGDHGWRMVACVSKILEMQVGLDRLRNIRLLLMV